MNKKILFSNIVPEISPFGENYSAYGRSDSISSKGKNIPYKSSNDLKFISKEDSVYDEDYRLDGPDSGIRSTQQINIDYEVFENHVFFDSAVSKVNIAFDKIVNEFPFDASESDVNEFKQGLTGYERYIYNNFAKNTGYLNFSGSAVGEHNGAGQYVQIEDSAGRLYPSFSTRNDFAPVLSPKNSPFTIEFFVRIPEKANSNQSIFQLRQNRQTAIAVSLSGSSDTSSCNAIFDITSGSIHTFVSASLNKGKFNHVACVYSYYENSKSGLSSIYVDGVLQNTSSISLEIENFNLGFQNSKAYIGSGSSINTENADTSVSQGIFIPQQTFSGSIDEFRFYHEERSLKQIKDNMFKNVFGGVDSRLAAYYRFNEPSGSYNIPDICLDASSNSLHAKIINFNQNIRNTGSIGESPLKQELPEDNPVLYPEYLTNGLLHDRLINSASLYDEKNPNLITNLIPVHYFIEGNDLEGLQNFTGSYGDPYKAKNIPKSGQVGSGQLLMSFLFLWAKYFDEIKIYIDTLSRIINYGYDLQDVAVEKFLPFIGRYYGIDLPGIFARANQRQYNTRTGINNLSSLSTYTLYEVQNKIWRQILSNLNVLRQGKGTISSVKGIIRTLGVEPDSIFDIREYGGPKAFYLDGRRKNIKKNYQMLDFSGSFATVSENLNAQGFSLNKPHLIGSYLTASRIEAGFPEPRGTFVQKDIYPPHGISNIPDDGLLTSGSFSLEGIFQFPTSRNFSQYQSLFRLNTTGSVSGIQHQLMSNVVLKKIDMSKKDDLGELSFYFDSDALTNNASSLHTLKIHSASLFDGNPWYVNISFIRGDDPYTRSTTQTSSSFHLRCASLTDGTYFSTSSLGNRQYYGNPNSPFNNNFSRINTSLNASGAFVTIGSQSINVDSAGKRFLNSSNHNSIVRSTDFGGKVNFLRFWSKGTTEEEAKERGRNLRSLGVDLPNSQYNHSQELTGGFNRIRSDVKIGMQAVTASNSSGGIKLSDFSQNSLFLTGSGFEANRLVLKNELFLFSSLSPKFDIRSSDIKVRVRSYLQKENIESDPFAKAAPVFNLDDEFSPEDDNRFTVDLSAVKALDEDIMKMLSSLQTFDNALGDPRDLFEDSYIDLENLRKVYFNDLTEKLNLSSYSEFFTWFDLAFTDLIGMFLPLRANFLGVNHVIESHVLERHKAKYFYDDQYLMNRPSSRDTYGSN